MGFILFFPFTLLGKGDCCLITLGCLFKDIDYYSLILLPLCGQN